MVVLKGMDKVLRNLNKEIKKIENRTQAGVTAAALKVKAESQKLTPVDTGNLKASAYVSSPAIKNIPSAEIGYTASYAIYVHEMEYSRSGKKITHPTGQWKFLETALFSNQKEILRIIKSYARIK